MKRVLVAGAIALISSSVFAQSPDAPANDASLATPMGHEVSVGVSGYTYIEPGDLRISIHGAKFTAEYSGTYSLDERQHWFARANVRGTVGSTTYDGWCGPWRIVPDNTSPNGYALDLGDFSPCSESGERDWYLEGRALVGKDVIGQKWTWSPEGGLGVRHLSNGTAGIAGFRTDNYLYLPLGITARTMVASRSALSFNLEYDRLIRGWQTTRDSALGGGDVPATTATPAFTIESFTDISFSQRGGWAVRASASYRVNTRWSVEPYYVHWRVDPSPVNFETVTFAVNNVAAHQRLGAFEPVNVTNEFGVKLGFRLF